MTASYFDVDGTLISTSLVRATLFYVTNQPTPWKTALRLGRVALAAPAMALAELLDRRTFNELLYSSYEGMSEDRLLLLADELFERVLLPSVYPGAAALLASARQGGRRVVLVSGALDFMLKRLAEHLGADEVIANRLEMKDGIATGKLLRPVVAGPQKARLVREHARANGHDLDDCHAFSDSYSDLPMLSLVGHPAAVNPDLRLALLARAYEWPSFRLGERSVTLSSHPSVAVLAREAASRVLFSGERLLRVTLPAGARALYPKPALHPVADVDESIREALESPLGSVPLSARLRPGQRVTLVVGDASLPLPPSRGPDVSGRMVEAVLSLLRRQGVEDVEVVLATGTRRKLCDAEVRALVGERVFAALGPARLRCFDCEDPAALCTLPGAEPDEVLEVSRRVAESDLVVHVNLRALPVADVTRSLGAGVCSYRSWRSVRRRAALQAPAGVSASVAAAERLDAALGQRVPVFAVEATVSHRWFDGRLSILTANPDDLSLGERLSLDALVAATARLPGRLRQALLRRSVASAEVTGVWAGDAASVQQRALHRAGEQHWVPVVGPADVVVCGVPPFGPHNRGSFLNPLLVSHMVHSTLFGLHLGAPLLRPGGTVIVTHPCTDRFDYGQHTSYLDFLHRVLRETRDPERMAREFEPRMAADPAFLHMYRRGHGYHPGHPFELWYDSEPGRRHAGRVLVVGADNETVPRLLGWETARTMADALYAARGGERRELAVTLLAVPPLLGAAMSDGVAAGGAA